MITLVVNNMNPVIEAIKNRRSTRSYEQKPIPKDLLNIIIETGNQVVSSTLWHEAHRVKCPDLARQRAGEARHQLMEKKIVASDGGRVWVINENN